MRNKTDLKSNRLPCEEWQFSDIESEYLNQAFFYEFARQSPRIRPFVQKYRELCKTFYDESFELRTDLSSEQIDKLQEQASQFKQDEYALLIAWLSECECFPETPFVEAQVAGRMNEFDVWTEVPGVVVMGHCFAQHADKEYFDDIIGSCDFNQCERTMTLHMLCIDWRKPNKELVDDFANWIEGQRTSNKNRPGWAPWQDRINIEPTRMSMRAFFNRPLELPKECKKINTALAHLGKLRCLEAAGSWAEYLKIYHSPETDQRSLEKDVKAARDVLSWVESLLCPSEKTADS